MYPLILFISSQMSLWILYTLELQRLNWSEMHLFGSSQLSSLADFSWKLQNKQQKPYCICASAKKWKVQKGILSCRFPFPHFCKHCGGHEFSISTSVIVHSVEQFSADVSGEYFEEKVRKNVAAVATDQGKAEKLWNFSEKLIKKLEEEGKL